MSFMNFLRQIGSGVSKGVGWIGRNVISPVSGFLKKVPVVGDVVSAAEPLGNFIQKSADYSADFYDGKPESERRAKPTLAEAGNALQSGLKTVAAVASGGKTIAAEGGIKNFVKNRAARQRVF